MSRKSDHNDDCIKFTESRLKAVKAENGLMLAQSPDSAKFDGMSHSAPEAVIADIFAPTEELPAKHNNFRRYIPAVVNIQLSFSAFYLNQHSV